MDLESGPSRRPHLEPLLAILCQQQASVSEGFCPNMRTESPILALLTTETHSTLPKFIALHVSVLTATLHSRLRGFWGVPRPYQQWSSSGLSVCPSL